MKLCSLDLCWTSSWLPQSVHGLRHCELRKRGHKERHQGSADTEKATQEIARLSVSVDSTDMIQVVLAQGSAVFFSSKRGILLRMCQIVSVVKGRKPPWETGWQQDTKRKVGQRHRHWNKLRPNTRCILIFFLFSFCLLPLACETLPRE